MTSPVGIAPAVWGSLLDHLYGAAFPGLPTPPPIPPPLVVNVVSAREVLTGYPAVRCCVCGDKIKPWGDDDTSIELVDDVGGVMHLDFECAAEFRWAIPPVSMLDGGQWRVGEA